MKRTLIAGILIFVFLVLWGASYYVFPPENVVETPTKLQKPGVFATKTHFKGRDQGNLSWEISSDKLNIDISYKHFTFEGNVEGKVFRNNKLSLKVKSEKMEIDTDKEILKIPTKLSFTTEDGFVGEAPQGVWYFDSGEFISENGRVTFEKIGEFKAEADIFRFSTQEGRADFEGNVVIETSF
ncbi:MAG TPA: hypothetical protein PL130_05700 [Dictyoglomaceae bacterium]|nr:hypothetical protein [Dictyoglomaceae bacterium]HPU43979.1 hypothetical protein [Dictyoglomaceae bacterium]